MAQINSYLQVENLTKSVGERVLFHDITFGVAERQRVGLIAQNGTGKTTLLNILAGKDSAESGSVVLRRGLRLGYLEQEPHYPMDLTVMEACFWQAGETTNLIREYETCLATPGNPGLEEILSRMDHQGAWDYENTCKQILTRLDIVDTNQTLATLSGGQLKRVALANVLIAAPDMLILDEPTNHLDLAMIEWLEDYLSRSSMTLLMVTHDRYFLDRVCSHIIELDEATLYTYHGNYAYYLEKRQERLDTAKAGQARAANLFRTELEWMRRMPQARGHKARYREEAFADLQQRAQQKVEEQRMKLEVKATYIGSKIFEAEYVSKAFGEKVILKDFYYNFARFEKLGLVGGNGTGKSTFVKMLLGEVQPDGGRFVVGQTVRFGYFSQEGIHIEESMKVIDVIRRKAEYIDLGGGRHMTAMQFLQHFMFTPDQQQNYVYKLSGGEKRRLQLCTVLIENPNFLVLDEPTNDLDIVSLQVLEEYLQTFRGCVIVVSHDRYFMDKVVDHLLVFKGQGTVKDFPGNYTQYRDYLALAPKPETTPTETKKPAHTSEHRRRLTWKEQKEMESLEADIQTLEKEKKDLEEALSSGNLNVEQITTMSRRLPLLHEELDEKEMRWLELSEI